MTRLLVSVRSVAEAKIALAAGAHLIDVKEPNRGALGAADAETCRQIVQAIADNSLGDSIRERTPCSAALGELLDFDDGPVSVPCTGLHLAKLGLAGCAGLTTWAGLADWPRRWHQAMQPARSYGVISAVVAYADADRAVAPSVWQILERAEELSAGALLVDTFDKRGGTLLEIFSIAELSQISKAAHARGWLVAFAGSLRLEDFHRFAEIDADYLAVRGAACSGGRLGTIDGEAVGRLLNVLPNGIPPVACQSVPRQRQEASP